MSKHEIKQHANITAIILAVIVIFGAVLCVRLVVAPSKIEVVQPTEMVYRDYEMPMVVDANLDDDTLFLHDKRGEEWIAEGEGYEMGQPVVVIMNDNATHDYLLDDWVVDVIERS